MCQIIERPIVDIRILGKTERIRIAARGTSLFCTGNNITIVGDLCRRVVTAMLDPELERPELREFKGNPVAKVLVNRGTYVAAALTVCRAYILAGQPMRAPRLASFEGWSDTVRSALIWLGCADPVKSMDIARAEDPQLGALRAVLDAWAAATGIGWQFRVTLHGIVKLADERWPEDQAIRYPQLFEAIQAVAAGNRSVPTDAKRLGNWLRQYRGRVVGDLRLMNEPSTRGGSCILVDR